MTADDLLFFQTIKYYLLVATDVNTAGCYLQALPKSTAYFFIDPSEGISGNFFWGEDRFRPDLAFS